MYTSFSSLGRFIPRYFFLLDMMVNWTVALISLSDSLLLVYRNEADLRELILCPVLILAFLMFYHIHWWTLFSGGVFWIFSVLYHVICKQWQLHLFFSNLNFFHFSSLIAVSGTPTILFRKSGKSGHLCLVSDLRRNAFCFSSLSMMLAVDLSYMTLGFLCTTSCHLWV